MIVKVQLSLYPPGGSSVYIYDENREVAVIEATSPELRQRMGERIRAYFHATVADNKLELGEEAPWQEDW